MRYSFVEVGALRSTVLIMCNLSFYKLQIRTNYFLESLCKMQSIKGSGWRLPRLRGAWIQRTNLGYSLPGGS